MKFFVFILCSVFAVGYVNIMPDFFELEFIPPNATYSVVLEKEDDYFFKEFNTIRNGNTIIVSTSFSGVKKIKSKNPSVLGESFSFCGDEEDFFNLIKHFSFINFKVDDFNDIKNIYGYSRKFNASEYIDILGERYNIQIALNNGLITVGYPIIVGSYWLKFLNLAIIMSRRFYEKERR